MNFTYKTKGGVCSSSISFKLENGIVEDIKFKGGCNGNTQGIASLVSGMEASSIIEKLKNIKCGFKSTSCPDQLANAIEEALKGQSPQKTVNL